MINEQISTLQSPDSSLNVAINLREDDIIEEVENSLKSKRLLLAYQPVINTSEPFKPIYYEGLIRIINSSGGVIPAREFMDRVEVMPAGRKIDCFSLSLGLQTLIKYPKLRLSINMSARSIAYKPWREILLYGLRQHPDIAKRLIFEITECSAMIIPEIVQTFMEEHQPKGITFALDNFGSGNTSFEFLKSFMFDIMKIDGKYIRNIQDCADSQVILQALLSIGEHFEMFTIAESVEASDEVEFLLSSGVNGLQGYYFGYPAPKPSWRGVPLEECS